MSDHLLSAGHLAANRDRMRGMKGLLFLDRPTVSDAR